MPYNLMPSSAISLNRCRSKIGKGKVSRYCLTVSNGTILATKQKFFFTKVASVQSITDIELLSFFINTAYL